jgi:transposase-like protein
VAYEAGPTGFDLARQLTAAGVRCVVAAPSKLRALGEELTRHLGYDKHDPAGRGSGNSRNGGTPKRLSTEIGGIDLDAPRDRNGTFNPHEPEPPERVRPADHARRIREA